MFRSYATRSDPSRSLSIYMVSPLVSPFRRSLDSNNNNYNHAFATNRRLLQLLQLQCGFGTSSLRFCENPRVVPNIEHPLCFSFIVQVWQWWRALHNNSNATFDPRFSGWCVCLFNSSRLLSRSSNRKKKKTRRRVESSIRLWLHDTIRILSIYLLLCQYLGFSARRSAKIKATRKRGVCGGETPTERGRDGSTRRRIIIIIIISITLLENERKRRSRNQEFQFLSFLFTSHYIYVHWEKKESPSWGARSDAQGRRKE